MLRHLRGELGVTKPAWHRTLGFSQVGVLHYFPGIQGALQWVHRELVSSIKPLEKRCPAGQTVFYHTVALRPCPRRFSLQWRLGTSYLLIGVSSAACRATWAPSVALTWTQTISQHPPKQHQEKQRVAPTDYVSQSKAWERRPGFIQERPKF